LADGAVSLPLAVSGILADLGPFAWFFVALLAANLALVLLLVVLRLQWVVHLRRRERVERRLAPVVERLVSGKESDRAVSELRGLLAGFGRLERPAAAWLLRDATRGAGDEVLARVREILEESGAIELAERGTRRRMPWRRALACEVLGAFASERSVPVLLERLSDRRLEVRTAAARALGAIGSPAAAPALTTLFLERKGVPTGVAHDALRGLGALGADAFRRGLASADATVRVTSCFGSARPADPAAAEALARVLAEDENVRVKTAAAAALGVVGGDGPPHALVEAAARGEPRVRWSAVSALRSYDDPVAVEPLGAALDAADRELALRAAESLLVLARKPAAGPAAGAVLSSSPAWSVEYTRALAELRA
jgi:HEAT repeat protein